MAADAARAGRAVLGRPSDRVRARLGRDREQEDEKKSMPVHTPSIALSGPARQALSRRARPATLSRSVSKLEEEDAPQAAEPQENEGTELDAMLAESPAIESSILAPSGRTECLVGEIVDTKHPALTGRVRVRYRDLEGQTFEKWLPTLHGLPVRVADRVLMTRAGNWPELVVTGVIDGFAARPEPTRETKAALELQRDEAIRVQASDGTTLLEVFEGEEGPVVRLLSENVDLELAGSFRVRAQSIELEATRGQARIKATDDVVVKGEVIHLN
jgi:hypothetical protein